MDVWARSPGPPHSLGERWHSHGSAGLCDPCGSTECCISGGTSVPSSPGSPTRSGSLGGGHEQGDLLTAQPGGKPKVGAVSLHGSTPWGQAPEQPSFSSWEEPSLSGPVASGTLFSLSFISLSEMGTDNHMRLLLHSLCTIPSLVKRAGILQR